MAPERPITALGVEAGLNDIKIEKQVPTHSLLDRAIDDMLQGGQLTSDIYTAITGKPRKQITSDTPFSQVPFSKGVLNKDAPIGRSELARQLEDFQARAGDPVKLPKDMTKEELDRDIDTAINVGMGTGPGTITGMSAVGFDKAAARVATALERQGIDPENIWKTTGTFRGAEGRWRQEISDANMKLKEAAFEVETIPGKLEKGSDWTAVGGTEDEVVWRVKHGLMKNPPKDVNSPEFEEWLGAVVDATRPHSLDAVIDHPELFKAYPQLKEYNVAPLPQEFIDRGVKGQVSGKTIYLAPGHPEYLRSVIAHEVQHGVQAIEGFARGGNAGEFVSAKLKVAQDQFNKVKEATIDEMVKTGIQKDIIDYIINLLKFSKDPDLPNREAWLNQINVLEKHWKKEGMSEDFQRLKNIAEGQAILDTEALKHGELYRRLAGEVEARNVQTRLNMDAVERLVKSPRATEDRPRFIQRRVGQSEQIEAK
jgi:hypothetical protein